MTDPLLRQSDAGPFDIIGDIHGCHEEMVELLKKLGYSVEGERFVADSNTGRRVIFLGDLVDRGPGIVSALKLAMHMVASGVALCVPGNHDEKLTRKILGRAVRMSDALESSLVQLEAEPPEFSTSVAQFFASLPSHFVLDGGRLVVAHAGLPEEMLGEQSEKARSFALYGEITGKHDEYGLPIRGDWPSRYKGAAKVVYGHTPVPCAKWVNNTINIDTGCVFGGRLTALRYPELEILSVPSRRVYWKSPKPFATEESSPSREMALLDGQV